MAWEALERLRVYSDESDTVDGATVYSRVVSLAHERGLAGATVYRAMMGFGGTNRIHTARLLEISSDLPVIVEVVDTPERIEAFSALLLGILRKGMLTRECVSAAKVGS